MGVPLAPIGVSASFRVETVVLTANGPDTNEHLFMFVVVGVDRLKGQVEQRFEGPCAFEIVDLGREYAER